MVSSLIIVLMIIGVVATVGVTQREQIQSMIVDNNKPDATQCEFAGQRLSEEYYCVNRPTGNSKFYLDIEKVPNNSDFTASQPQPKVPAVESSLTVQTTIVHNADSELALIACKRTFTNTTNEIHLCVSGENPPQQQAPEPHFELSSPSWTYISETDSTFKVTVSNTGDTVMNIDGVKIGGNGFVYTATVEPKQSHVIVISTSGIAKAEMLGLAYTYTVNTIEGTSRTGSVAFAMTAN